MAEKLGIGYPRAIGHIGMVPKDESDCSDCGTCEVVCSMTHDGGCSPALRRIWLDRDPSISVYIPVSCAQCDAPSCMEACDSDAMYIDEKTGARCIDADKCNGCKLCMKACPFDPPMINYDPDRKVAVKCDLCKDRPNGPACIEHCITQCLTIIKHPARKKKKRQGGN